MKYNLIILIGLLGFAMGGLISCYRSADRILDQSNFTTNQLSLIEGKLRLKFPSGARGLNMAYKGSQVDPAFVVKIEIPTNEVKSFKDQIEKIPNEDYHPIGLLSEKVSWWKAAESQPIVKRMYTVDSSFVQLILCTESNQIVLYGEQLSF